MFYLFLLHVYRKDLWVDSINPDNYVSFLTRLHKRVSKHLTTSPPSSSRHQSSQKSHRLSRPDLLEREKHHRNGISINLHSSYEVDAEDGDRIVEALMHEAMEDDLHLKILPASPINRALDPPTITTTPSYDESLFDNCRSGVTHPYRGVSTGGIPYMCSAAKAGDVKKIKELASKGFNVNIVR